MAESLRDQFNSWTAQSASLGTEGSEGPFSSARNAFSSFTSSVNETANDYFNRLPFTSADADVQEPSWFQLSRLERLVGFIGCLLAAIACFTLSFFLFPVLALKPRKFGLLWSLGSLLFVISFGVLQGPVAYFKHLTSAQRLPFTCFFFGSVLLTVYFSAIQKSTILTLVFSLVEIVAVLYYTVSYFPFGAQTLRMMSSLGYRHVSSYVV